jgi:putative glutamine amidotransferase
MIGAHPFHAAGDKYVVAVRDAAGAIPLLVPVLDNPLQVDEILECVDGIFLTGSPSNVAPRHYSGDPPRDGVLQDERRDAVTLPLIRLWPDSPVLALRAEFALKHYGLNA